MEPTGLYRRSVAFASIAALVSLSAACGDGHSSASPPATTLVPTTTTTTLPAVPAFLRGAIIDAVTPGYQEQPTGAGFDGPIDINKEAGIRSTDVAAAIPILREYGYQRGYRRAWFPVGGGTTSFITIRVLAFQPAYQARYFYHFLEGSPTDPSNPPKFPVPGVADSYRLSENYRDSSGEHTRQIIEMFRGPLLYAIAIAGPVKGVTPEQIIPLAQAQVALAESLGYR